MPTINRTQKKQTYSEPRKETDMRKLRQKAYQLTAWRKLRNSYLREHPICAECLRNGKITPAEDVHHVKSPFKGGEINYELLLDDKNLESVCKECHAAIHNKQQGHVSPQDILKQLDDLFDENKPDSDFEE